ncbi:hypothetical protein ACJJJB_17565 [Microbulbifer sp. ANSA001]|uniref:hypothetical protein n=1 Tax=Microbulbifer sp. ANSA001 TaxID=3243358 RepID=UPI004040F159
MRAIISIISGIFAFGVSSIIYANHKSIPADLEIQPVQVMLFGVFHFHNPGLDTVKSEVTNALTPSNQDYLEELTSKLTDEPPTHVLIECPSTHQRQMDQKFNSYKNGSYELSVNENQ